MHGKDCKFNCTAPPQVQAAEERRESRIKQLDFWMAKRNAIMATIKEGWLQSNDKIVLANRNNIGFNKCRDLDRGGEVVTRNDPLEALIETHEKLTCHTKYKNWDTYDR